MSSNFTPVEIAHREADLIATLDAKNLADLREKRPEIVAKIERLIEVGHGAKKIGQLIRRFNPQMWVESKFAESVVRALLEDKSE